MYKCLDIDRNKVKNCYIKVVLKSDILTAFFKALPIPLVFEFGTSNSKYILRSGGATS